MIYTGKVKKSSLLDKLSIGVKQLRIEERMRQTKNREKKLTDRKLIKIINVRLNFLQYIFYHKSQIPVNVKSQIQIPVNANS